MSSANVESIHSEIQERHHTSEMNQVYEQAGHTKGDTDGRLVYGTLLSLARNQKIQMMASLCCLKITALAIKQHFSVWS